MANIKKKMKQNIANQKLLHAEETALFEETKRKEKNKHNAQYLAKAAVIAAVYFGLTFFIGDLSYSMIQFRISEILVALVFFEPAAFPGLCVGCCLANLVGPGAFYDAVLGTCGTAVGIYGLKWYCERKGKPVIGLLIYAVLNSFMVAMELNYISVSSAEKGIVIIFLWVALGEIVTSVGGGSLLYCFLKKRWKDIIGETKKSEEQRIDPSINIDDRF